MEALLSEAFVMIVLLACLAAIPVTNYFLHQWLQKYACRVPVTWWIFAAAVAGALSITLLTVSYQTIRADRINLVKSLKTE
ncbi:MAG: hypothetical protein INR73_05710 [Williamsia sp.]|nr:hypothetical protein [Williamsia sp.]